MLFEIKSRWTGNVLFRAETGSLKLAVEAAVGSGADLRGADLRGADLRGADLRGAVLRGADLRDADLSGAVLRGADLRDADLRDADLRGAVLRGGEFYRVPQLHNKMLEAVGSGGTLDMSSWHKCDTTHCRAGWAVHLAGNAGKLLEAQMGTAMAGALIHVASCPWMEKVPDFYATDEVALEDIKAQAALELAK
jgi:uncharacterized protein YjbI with pentapeptide repeats